MNLSKYLKQKDFEKVYTELEKENFDYSLNKIAEVFPNCDSILLYAFLMYSISKKDTAEKHLSICECLIYMEPYIYEVTSMVYWHINYAFSLTNDPTKLMAWVIEVYGADPSSPFSESEITSFAQKVLLQYPNNSVAYNILNPSKNS